MAISKWWVAGLVPALLVGCARGRPAATEMDEMAARLPEPERRELINYEQKVTVAESNVTAATVAHEDAQKYSDVADDEVDAAKSRLEAAKSALDLGRGAQDERIVQNAEKNYNTAQAQMAAATAKKEYADRLVELRSAELSRAEAERDVAKANQELMTLEAGQRHGMASDRDEATIQDSLRDAKSRVQTQDQAVERLSAELKVLQSQAEERRHAAEQLGAPSTPITPPKAPKPIETSPAPTPKP